MPIYEFRCADCGHVFEELVMRASDQEDLACPKCSARAVERVLSCCSVGAGGSAAGAGAGPSCTPRGGFS
jgi:putative FmdB family regulatory protein